MIYKNLSLIVAVDKHMFIGYEGQLPWGYIKEDMEHFRKTTMGYPVLFGRKTYEGLPNKLDGREVYVLTSQRSFKAEGCKIIHHPDDFLEIAKKQKVFVAGGASVYRDFFFYASELIVTHLNFSGRADRMFPIISTLVWEVKDGWKLSEDKDIGEVKVYRRFGVE